jgi:hypothetical protein
VARLERWQRQHVVPTAQFVSLIAAAERLGVGVTRTSIWVYTGRLRRAYLSGGEEGVERTSLAEFARWREEAGILSKVAHALGTFVRLV